MEYRWKYIIYPNKFIDKWNEKQNNTTVWSMGKGVKSEHLSLSDWYVKPVNYIKLIEQWNIPGFATSYVIDLFCMFNDLRWEVIVHFVEWHC